MSDIIIKVENLGKKYRIRHQQEQQRYVALRDVFAERLLAPWRWLQEWQIAKREELRANANGNNVTHLTLNTSPNALTPLPEQEDFWALRDVSFEVKQGEAIGIIGRNGAGKSTLLKVLSRITEPTEGRIKLHGRVASLLEVGTGFHPELTGRENIFLNGAILGMGRGEVKRKFGEIVAFAEVERFLDTPVKRYSSGMYVRLAFAVAAHLEPEILVVDEVLAVGDVAFQRKCLGRMENLSHSGRTVLFVSHNMQAIRSLCKKAIWLEGGQIRDFGESGTIVEDYLEESVQAEQSHDLDERIAQLPPDPNFRLQHVSLEQDSLPVKTVLSGKPAEVVVHFSVLKETPGLHVYVDLFDAEGMLLLQSLHNGDAEELPIVEEGDYVSRLVFPAEFLAPRTYEVTVYASIASVRYCMPQPVRMPFDVQASGRFNRAYPGYVTPGRLAPLLEWKTRFCPRAVLSSTSCDNKETVS